jgi:hypothetical protein
MKTHLAIALFFISGLESIPAHAQYAHAQYYGGWDRGWRSRSGNVERSARTRRESYAYGLSDVTRARSQANLTNAQALSTLSDVRRNEIQNNLDYTNMFFDRRRINAAYQESQRRPRATSEQLARFAAEGMPSRSSGSQIDSITGEISWPFVLQASEFDEYRKTIDELFKYRAVTGSVMGRDPYLQTRAATDDLMTAFRGQIRELRPNEFTEGRQFIEMLKYESRQPPS